METHDLFDLSGRTALVTGGGRGIGLDMAVGLAEAGANILVASRKIANCEAAAEEIRKLGRQATAFAVDMSSGEDIDRFVAALDQHCAAPIDILVNNAGVSPGARRCSSYPLEGWDKRLQRQRPRPLAPESAGRPSHEGLRAVAPSST